jgi:hypothetical protein
MLKNISICWKNKGKKVANKYDFMKSRKGIIINKTSTKMEQAATKALIKTIDFIEGKFNAHLNHASDMYLKDVIIELCERYKGVDFSCRFDKSSMRPDGGILSIVSKHNIKYPILITEVKTKEQMIS